MDLDNLILVIHIIGHIVSQQKNYYHKSYIRDLKKHQARMTFQEKIHE